LGKYVEKIQVSVKSDKNKGHCTWRPIHFFYPFKRRIKSHLPFVSITRRCNYSSR